METPPLYCFKCGGEKYLILIKKEEKEGWIEKYVCVDCLKNKKFAKKKKIKIEEYSWGWGETKKEETWQ